MTQLFDKFATITITTKRPPAISGGKRGAPVAYITTPIASTPIVPVSPEIAIRLNIGTPYEAKEIFVFESADIKEGDLVTIASIDYRVVAVAEWPWEFGVATFLRIILEEDK